jgi:uncharacterized protein YlxP (DUF503 family)
MAAVGFLIVTLYMDGNDSLKDKRKVVKSVLARVRARFNCSSSEVGLQDDRDQALLGFSVCGPETRILRSVLNRVLDFIDNNADAEVVDYEIHCPLALDFDDEYDDGYSPPYDDPLPSDYFNRQEADDALGLIARNLMEANRAEAEANPKSELKSDPKPGPKPAPKSVPEPEDGDDDPTPPGVIRFPGPKRRGG